MPFLHHLLTTQAQTDGEGIAALLGDDTLTFGQAETGADRVAAGLALLGVRPGDRVGLHLTRSLQLWPALFGLLGAGAVCVPVDRRIRRSDAGRSWSSPGPASCSPNAP
ncbi:AMP-binding protein [Streptomyces lydicus]|nr:AMP-binding protein [Streptomyces lydicus]